MGWDAADVNLGWRGRRVRWDMDLVTQSDWEAVEMEGLQAQHLDTNPDR